MKQKRRSAGFILAILCTFTLLLAACQAGTSSNRHTLTQNTTRLNLRETPAASDTMTPGDTTTPSTTITAPTEYVGQEPAENAWVGLSTTGKRMVAFITDGSQNHQATFAQWFRGSVANGVVDATAPAKTGADRLQATLTGDTATGTVTLANSKSIAFTAHAVSTTDQTAGLYRGEREVSSQHYIAGWIVLPAASATGTPTPSATSTGTPSAQNTTTPGAIPPLPGGLTPSATGIATPVATGTATPYATGTPTPSTTTGALQQGGAILNQQNSNVLPVPPLTQEQINSKQINIPNLATFKLVPCQQNLC